MAEKSNFSDLFLILVIVFAGALVIFGGLVTWKLVRSTTPQVERVHMDPDDMLEKGLAIEKQQDSQVLELAALRAKKSGEKREDFWEEPETTEEVNKEEAQPEETTSQTVAESQPSVEVAPVSEEEPSPDEEPISSAEFVYTLEDVTAAQPQVVPQETVNPKPPVVRKTPPQKVFETYEQGLLRCQREQVFPCAWKDNSNESLMKQYWLRNFQGPVERIVYTRNGKVISKTQSALDGEVLNYKGPYAELYFEGGLLTKIRTFPYENPDLRDWFLIGKDGKLSACLCGKPVKDCCARSLLYREGGHRKYCEIFPRDSDFCK